MSNTITDVLSTDEGQTTFIWHPNKIIENLKAFQVYGFCLDRGGKVCLVRDKDEKRFTLPGGHIEDGETAEEALKREFIEEAQFTPINIKILGSLEIKVVDKNLEVVDHHQQVRFVCIVGDVTEFVPQKDDWETVERIFVDHKKLPDYIEWIAYPTGKAQFADFLKHLDR